MTDNYWSTLNAGWGWMLWLGFIFLIFSTTGNWGYTYQAHRRYRDLSYGKDALDILSERYAKGDIKREEFLKMKDEISSTLKDRDAGQRSRQKQTGSTMGASLKGT